MPETQDNSMADSQEVKNLKSVVDKSNIPTIFCTNVKEDNPHFLGITHFNQQFCETFGLNDAQILGKGYDFLFENQETDYSSEDQISMIQLLKSIKSHTPCSISQKIKELNEMNFLNYRISFNPILSETQENKYYSIFTFEQISKNKNIQNQDIDLQKDDIGLKNQELVKSLEKALNNEKILREIGYQIISDKSVKGIAQNICESICKILKVERCLIHDLNDGKVNFIVEYNSLKGEASKIDHQDALDYILDQNAFYQKIRQNTQNTSIFIIGDITKDPSSQKYSEFYDKYDIASQICAFSYFNNQANGGIYVQSSVVRNPTIDEVEMLEIISDQLSIAIERSNSIEKIVSANHELLQTTQQLKKSVQKEKEMREIQSKFITLVSHEFKTPLQIIDSTRELMSRKIRNMNLNDESFEKYSQRVKNAIIRMTNLINSTLNLAKIEENSEGQVTICKKDFDIHALLKDVIKKISDLLIKRNVSIETSFEAKQHNVNADPVLLEHCLSNIISNSIKYSKKNTDVTIQTSDDENNMIIVITDQGIGIPTDDIDQIGNKFFRAQNTLAESGSGIGLYLTKYFIELHNGNVMIESKENIGTKVTINLPKK